MHLSDNYCRHSKLPADKLSAFGISVLNTKFEQRRESIMKLRAISFTFQNAFIASRKKEDDVLNA